MEVPEPPPPIVFVFHGHGDLGGTCMLHGDVEGRPSYKREDGRLTLAWDSNERGWAMDVVTERRRLNNRGPANAVTRKVKQIGHKDEIDPTLIFDWEFWNQEKSTFIPDPHLDVQEGREPAKEVYVSMCSDSVANGVYNLNQDLFNNRPEYRKSTHAGMCYLHWDCDEDSWMIEAKVVDRSSTQKPEITVGSLVEAHSLARGGSLAVWNGKQGIVMTIQGDRANIKFPNGDKTLKVQNVMIVEDVSAVLKTIARNGNNVPIPTDAKDWLEVDNNPDRESRKSTKARARSNTKEDPDSDDESVTTEDLNQVKDM